MNAVREPSVDSSRTSVGAPRNDTLRVGPIFDNHGWAQATDLYVRTFGYTSAMGGISPRLLAGLAANGGSVIGAFDQNDALRGFAYGFCAVDTSVAGAAEFYHYSQAVVVDPTLQGSGIGRRLKNEQARIVAAQGLSHIRWSFDPLLTRNAHFNFNVLGARGIRVIPDMYDKPGTDRIIVEWDVNDWLAGDSVGEGRAAAERAEVRAAALSGEWMPEHPPIESIGPDAWGQAAIGQDRAWVVIPSLSAATDLDAVGTARSAVMESILNLSAQGFLAIGSVPLESGCALYLWERTARERKIGNETHDA